MANFFRSTAPPTALQQAIDKATDSGQATEDWGLIMKICDHVTSHEEGAREAMKIIRKRLQTNIATHGWRPIVLTLTLLEALTKNCGKYFHLQVAHRDFLKELKAVIGPKNNPSLAIQEKVLGMIQTWALAFRHDPDLKAVEHFYDECVQQGLQFPPADSPQMIEAVVPPTGTIDRASHSSRTMNRPAPEASPSSSASGAAPSMGPEQVAKLRSELDIVQTNAQVFGEMLVTLQPGDENPEDFELLKELHKTCKQMQARVVDLLGKISMADVTADLLRYNDEFNNSFKAFENYIEERERRSSRSAHTPTNTFTRQPPPAVSFDNEPALIRFDDDDVDGGPATLTTGFQNMNIQPTSSRPVQQPALSATSATTRTVAHHQDPECDVKEVEQWLKIQGDDSDNDEHPAPSANGTTTAFNNFLQKRASTIPAEPSSSQSMYPPL